MARGQLLDDKPAADDRGATDDDSPSEDDHGASDDDDHHHHDHHQAAQGLQRASDDDAAAFDDDEEAAQVLPRRDGQDELRRRVQGRGQGMPRRLWPIDWAVEPHDNRGATDDDDASEDDHGASDHDGGAHHNGRRLLHRVCAHRVPRGVPGPLGVAQVEEQVVPIGLVAVRVLPCERPSHARGLRRQLRPHRVLHQPADGCARFGCRHVHPVSLELV